VRGGSAAFPSGFGILGLAEEVEEEKEEERGEVRLCVLFAHFSHFFEQLVETDPDTALQCLDTYERVLR
jgi:hypothetical protein